MVFQGAIQGPEEFVEGMALGVKALVGGAVGKHGCSYKNYVCKKVSDLFRRNLNKISVVYRYINT